LPPQWTLFFYIAELNLKSMKNKTFLSLSGVLLALALFGCSTGQKFSKRSFGGGWNENVATNQVKTDVPTHSEEAVVPSNVYDQPSAKVEDITANENIAVQPHSTIAKAQKNSKTAVAQKASFKQKVAAKIIQKKMNKQAPNEVDNKLLLVIICLLGLPWLAVLLYDGVGTHFWISLLLWFLFIVPGIIYGLLVVLDVI
jgi:uncharacterized membrane protein YqaE (UPF0057 family)